MPPRPKKVSKPQAICDDCLGVNQLEFDPRMNLKKLEEVTCAYCNHKIINKESRRALVDEKIMDCARRENY